MAEKKITRKDLYARIAVAMADDPEVVAFCEKSIAQIEKAAARPRKARVNTEAVAFANDVYAFILNIGNTEGPVTNKEIANSFGVSAQKAAAAVRRLIAEGRVIRHEGEKKSAPATFTALEDNEDDEE